MVKNERAYPQFSMCGLNCGLCPVVPAAEEKDIIPVRLRDAARNMTMSNSAFNAEIIPVNAIRLSVHTTALLHTATC